MNVTIKAPTRTGFIEITGEAATLDVFDNKVRVVLHDGRITHRASGYLIGRYDGVRLIQYVNSGRVCRSNRVAARIALESIATRNPDFFSKLASAPIIN